MVEARKSLAEELFGQREPESLAEARLAKGMSQHDLAAATGLTQPHIAKIEARKLQIQLATALKLAHALSISVETLAKLALPFAEPEVHRNMIAESTI